MASSDGASNVFDLERLQQLSYERSKVWANFLNHIHESENQKEITLEELESLDELQEYADEDDDLASMEDETCVDNIDPEVFRDITNSTRLTLMLNGTNKLDVSSNEANNELIDMLNETLPVINEHNRQLKESGMDRILNTFDAKKIEEKVGGWLRRHNTLCGSDYTMTTKSQPDRRRETPWLKKKDHYYSKPACVPEDESESDDSFNSGETARYIRSSKVSGVKNSASTTMMIKTYRMVKSTRQALRDKYACAQDDDADSHMNELRLRRRLAKESARLLYKDTHYGHRPNEALYSYITPIHSQRRKVFRKRTSSNSYSTVDDSSSDSDGFYYNDDDVDHARYRKHKNCCIQRLCSRLTPLSAKHSQCRSSKFVSCSRNDRRYHYSKPHTHSIPNFPPSEYQRSGMKKPLKRLDNRPSKRESECKCCNEKRLCKKYRHVADTSTEEWIVEDCFSPKKKTVMTSTQFGFDKQIREHENSIETTITTKDHDVVGNMMRKEKEVVCHRQKSAIFKPNLHEFVEDKSYMCKNPPKPLMTSTQIMTEEDDKNTQGMVHKEIGNTQQKAIVNKDKKAIRVPKVPNKGALIKPKIDKFVEDNTNTHIPLLTSTLIMTESNDKKKSDMFTIPDKPAVNKDRKTKTNPKTKVHNKEAKRRKNEDTPKSNGDDSFDRDLQIALKLSQDLYEKEKLAKTQKQKSITLEEKSNAVISTNIDDNNNNGTEKTVMENTDKVVENSPSMAKRKKLQQSQKENKDLIGFGYNDDISEGDYGKKKAETKLPNSMPQAIPKTIKKITHNKNEDKDELSNMSKVLMVKRNPIVNTSKQKSSDNKDGGNGPSGTRNTEDGANETNEIQKNHASEYQEELLNASVALLEKQNSMAKQKSSDGDNETHETHNYTVECLEKSSNAARVALLAKQNPLPKNFNDSAKDIHETQKNYNSEYLEKQSNATLNLLEKRNTITKKSKQKSSNIKETTNANNESQKNNNICPRGEKDQHNTLQTNAGGKDNTDHIFYKAKNNEISSNAIGENMQNHSGRHQSVMTTSTEKKGMLKLQKTKQGENHEKVRRPTKNSSQREINGCQEILALSNKKIKTHDASHRKVDEKIDITKPAKKETESLTNNNSKITSTTTMSSSPEMSKSSKSITKSQRRRQRIITIESSDEDDDIDCTVVSSTTMHLEPEEADLDTKASHSISSSSKLNLGCSKGILIYAPQNSSMAPSQSFSKDDGFFHITLEHLSKIIGQKPAEKFLKYYIGPRRFKSNSTIYYRPPALGVQATSDASTSDSDEDIFDYVNRCGDLYESFGGGRGNV
ncbi:chromosome alignment defect 1 [Haematobia irritans]|uniref:chromosome alignment defect 1 n=1 Tax=Haematobia irritans TaxID=7368 RepID=UPI003F50CCAF